MKITVLFLTIFSLLLLCGGTLEKPFYGSDRPKRSVKISGHAFTLNKNTAAEIVLAPGAPFLTRFAALELQKKLHRSLGKKFPVVQRPSPGKICFYIGRGPWMKEFGAHTVKFCRDSFVIRTKDRKLLIAGMDDPHQTESSFFKGGIWGRMYHKGTLFGVYEFLERFCGVRYYYPAELFTIVPQLKELKVPKLDIFDRPDFEFRRVSIYKGRCEESKPGEDPYSDHISPMKNLYYTTLRLQTRYIPNNHGTAALGYIDRFGKKHPEFFALLSDGSRSNSYDKYFPGQFCYSSPGLMEEIYKDAVALLTGKSAASRGIVSTFKKRPLWLPANHQTPDSTRPGVFGLMPQDGMQLCRCAECSRSFKKGPQAISDLIWSRFCAVSRKLQQNKIPGYTSLMAYYPYNLVPKVDIPDNMLVMLAQSGPWSNSPVRQKSDMELLRRWNKKLNYKVWLWNYLCKFGRLQLPDVPASTPLAVGGYYKRVASETTGAYMQSDTDVLIFNMLNYYVFSKVAWDNSADPAALVKEHCRLCYGGGADEMLRFFNRIEYLWMNKIGGRTVETPTGPLSVPPSESELFNAVFSVKELAGLEQMLSRARSKSAGDKKAAARILSIRNTFYEPLKKRAAEYRKKNDALAGYRIPLVKQKDGTFQANLRLQPFKLNGTSPVAAQAVLRISDREVCVTFECMEPRMAERAAVKRNFDDPEIWKDDEVEFFIDPAGHNKEVFQFLINSKGSFSDRRCQVAGSRLLGSFKWNAGARVRLQEKKDRFLLTLTIPRKALPEFSEKGFTANFTRSRRLKSSNGQSSLYSLSPFLVSSFHETENFPRFIWKDQEKNLVRQGDFSGLVRKKNYFGVWNLSRHIVPVCTQNSFISGGSALKAVIPQAQSRGFHFLRQRLPLKPGKRYRLSWYMKLEKIVPTGRNAGVSIKVFDRRNHFYPRTPVTGTAPWQRYVFEFTTEAPLPGKKYAPLMDIHCTNSYGTFYVDEIKLIELPSGKK